MDISDLNNSELTETMGSILSTSNENESQNPQDNSSSEIITEETNLASQNVEVIEKQDVEDNENLASTTCNDTLDTIDYTTETLSERDLNLIILGKPSTSTEVEELISSSNKDIIMETPSSSNIEEHEELWLGDNTRQLVKVDTDEDFEVIVKSLETAIVETERYDIDTVITSSEEPILSSVTSISDNSLGITIEPESCTESLLEDIPSNLLTSTVPPFPSQRLRLPESIEIPSPESSPVRKHNIDTYEEFATISEPKVESFDDQSSSLFEAIDPDHIPMDNEPSLLELQEASMPTTIPADFQSNLEFTDSQITLENVVEQSELDDDFESVEQASINEQLQDSEALCSTVEETDKPENKEDNIMPIKIVNIESQAESNNDEISLENSSNVTAEDNLLFSEIDNNVAELVLPQTEVETSIKLLEEEIIDQKNNEDIDLEPAIDTSVILEENKIVISEVRTLQISDESASEEGELDTTNKQEDFIVQKEIEYNDLESIIGTSEVSEECVLKEEERDTNKDGAINSQKENQDVDLEPEIDTSEVSEENKIILPKETVQIPEKSTLKKEELDATKKDEYMNVQKDIQDLVLEPVIDTSVVLEGNKIILSEETKQIPKYESELEQLDATNENENIKEQEDNQNINLEPKIDTFEILEENKLIISEVRTLHIPEQSTSKVEELHTINKDEDINSQKDNQDIDLKSIIDTSEIPEENKIILSAKTIEIPDIESKVEVKELDATNKDEDINAQKGNQNIDLEPVLDTSEISEEKIISSKESISEISMETATVVEEIVPTNKDEDICVQKDNLDVVLEPVIDTPKTPEEKIISSEETIQIPNKSSIKVEEIVASNKDEDINVQKDKQDIAIEIVIDTLEVPEEKNISSEEIILQIPKESVSVVEEKVAMNKDEGINVQKDKQDIAIEPIIDSLEVPEDSKIISPEETIQILEKSASTVEESDVNNKVIEDIGDLQSAGNTSSNSDSIIKANDATKHLNKDVLPLTEIGESSKTLKHSLDADVKEQSPPKRIKLVRGHFQKKQSSQDSQKDIDFSVKSEQKTSIDKEEIIDEIVSPASEQEMKTENITLTEKSTEGKETIQELLAKLEDPEETKSSECKTPIKTQKLKLQRNYILPQKTIKQKCTTTRLEKQVTKIAPTSKIEINPPMVQTRDLVEVETLPQIIADHIDGDMSSKEEKIESVVQSGENITILESKISEFQDKNADINPKKEEKEKELYTKIITTELKDDIQIIQKEVSNDTEIKTTRSNYEENMNNKNILIETQSDECISDSDKTTELVDVVETSEVSTDNIEITDNSQASQLDNVESDNILSETETNLEHNISTEYLSATEQIKISENLSPKSNSNQNINDALKENLIKSEISNNSTLEKLEDEHNIPQEEQKIISSPDKIESKVVPETEVKEPELLPTEKETVTEIENLHDSKIPVEKEKDTEVIVSNILSVFEDIAVETKEEVNNEIIKDICQTDTISTVKKETENLVNPEISKQEIEIRCNLQAKEKNCDEILISDKEKFSKEIQNINVEFNPQTFKQDTGSKINEQENKSQINKGKQVKTKQNLNEIDRKETEKSSEPLLKINTQFPLLSSRLQEKQEPKPRKLVEEINFTTISFPTMSHESVSKKFQNQLISESKEVSKRDIPSILSEKLSSREVTFISRNPEITFTKEIASSSQDHSATMESATKIKITKKRLGTPESTVTRSVTKPLSVQVDDLESSNAVERSHSTGTSSQKDSENMKYVIKSLKGEGRSSPKITIKPIKPPEEISGKSRSEESSHSPKITIKPIVKSDPLKITITKQKTDDSHSILKIYQPEDSQLNVGDQHVPKLTIKPIQRSDEMQHSPRITIKPVKPSPTASSMSPKITVKPVPSPSEQVEIIHSPKITVKPVVNPEESYPKVTIKPVLRPEESHKVSQLSPRQIKLKSMTFESSSGVTVEPICGTSSAQQKTDPESQTSHLKISVKPFAKIEESLSPKLTIKPITKTCEIVQSEDGTSNPLKLTIKPIMKPEEASYQSPKITIKPIVKPDEVNSPQSEEIDKPERIILKIQKNNLPSPKERIKESRKEPEVKIEAISQDQNQKLDKIKLKLTKEGNHAQIIPSVSQISSESTISLKRSLGLSDPGVLEKRSKTEFPGTELLHTSDISINLVEPNTKPSPKTISEEVTIMKIDKTSGNKEPVTEHHISQSRFKEMLMKIQQKPDITCTPQMEADPEYSSGSDDVKIVEVIENDPLKDPLSLHDESSSQDIMIVNEVINTNPLQKVQIINVETNVQTPKKRGRPRKNPLEVKPEIKGEDCVEVRPKRTCRAPPGRTPFVVKERKPRGAGRGRGGSRGRGASKSPKEPKITPRSKALKEAKELAKIEATRLAEEILIDEITIEDSTNDTPIATPVPSAEDSPKKPEVKEVEPPSQMIEPEVKISQVSESNLKQPPPPAVYEEETRMSADNSSRAQTPARQVFTAPLAEGPEESQSSVQSTATTESSKTKKGRLEVCDPDSAVTTVEQIVEYSWGNGGPYMLQEQIAQFLGVKSFKRKYPGLTRRSVEMQERDYIREKGLVSESMCDMGLTAVPSSEILDIMFQDFQDKYEEYRKCLRDKQAKEISNKQKAVSLATSQEKNKIDFKEKAIRSAASWNVNFNKARKESRKCCMDLQTFTINYPAGKVKVPHKNPVGHYPLALVPGQYTDFYKSYTPSELHYLPLNTVRYGPVLPNQHCEPGQSDGSQSESDSSSGSDSDSSDESMSTEEETPVICKTEVQLTQIVTTPKSKVH